ncbi:hypothetical protein Acr_02g0009180 [Actinidia rufa]|uniref:Uncharacterized protein n=1 Tax=Actinidia rufa TaxID=165716 RepID=A0A7J0E899_9ERIC|nr:hypothetical protein Acr_02g0009180 [Actinidia rufa]
MLYLRWGFDSTSDLLRYALPKIPFLISPLICFNDGRIHLRTDVSGTNPAPMACTLQTFASLYNTGTSEKDKALSLVSLDTFLAPKQGRKEVIEAYGEESHKYDHISGLFLKMQEVVFDAPPTIEDVKELTVEKSLQDSPPGLSPSQDIKVFDTLVLEPALVSKSIH